MATGDRVQIADKPTLDNIKTTVDSIKSTTTTSNTTINTIKSDADTIITNTNTIISNIATANSKIGNTADGGGSTSAGTVFAKENRIITDINSLSNNNNTIKSNIGSTGDTGGTTTSGTVMGKLNRLIDTDVYSYRSILLHKYASVSVSSSSTPKTTSIIFDTCAYYSFIPRILYIFTYKTNKGLVDYISSFSYRIGEKSSLTSSNFLSGNTYTQNFNKTFSSNTYAQTVYMEKFYIQISSGDNSMGTTLPSGSLSKFPQSSYFPLISMSNNSSNTSPENVPAVDYIKFEITSSGTNNGATGTSYINMYILCDVQKKFNR